MATNWVWVAYALAAALMGALLATLTKVGLRDAPSDLALAVQSVVILLIAWGNLTVQGALGTVRELDRRAWLYLLLAGAVSGAATLLLFRALKLAGASRVVPLDRLSLVFAIILGAAFLKERVGWQVIVGGTLMAVGALVIATATE
jgi:transporter family protein